MFLSVNQSTDVNATCVYCRSSAKGQPSTEEFRQFLHPFFTANSTTKCAGHAAYSSAVKFDKNKDVIKSKPYLHCTCI